MNVACGGAAFPELFFGRGSTFSLIDGLGVTVKEKCFLPRLVTIFVAQVRLGCARGGLWGPAASAEAFGSSVQFGQSLFEFGGPPWGAF